MNARERLREAKRIVVKVGTSTLVRTSGKPDFRRMDRLVREIADLKNAGREMVLVSSGAIALLMREKLQIKLKHGSHLSLYEIFTASGSIFSISSNPSRIVSNTASVKSSGASLSFRKKSPLATR